MRSTARAAEASDPAKNFHFSRRWSEPINVRASDIDQTSRRHEGLISHSDDLARIFARFADLPEVSP